MFTYWIWKSLCYGLKTTPTSSSWCCQWINSISRQRTLALVIDRRCSTAKAYIRRKITYMYVHAHALWVWRYATAFFQVLAMPVQKADANGVQCGSLAVGHVHMRFTLLIWLVNTLLSERCCKVLEKRCTLFSRDWGVWLVRPSIMKTHLLTLLWNPDLDKLPEFF